MLAVTRELKLALIVGFSLVLVVWVLITDHVKKSGPSEAIAPMRGDDPARLTTVGSGNANPFTSLNKPLTEPELPKPKPPADPGKPVHINQVSPDLGKLDTSPVEPVGDAGGLRPTTTPDKPYSVQSGDTLYNICKKQYGDASLHTRLAEYNKLTDGKALKLDQKLVLPAREVLEGKALPYSAKPAAPAVRPAADGLPNQAAVSTATYEVASGDTLTSIARAFDSTVAKVVELNPTLKGREGQLRLGEKLTVPKKAR
jgi:LysM repeat protein